MGKVHFSDLTIDLDLLNEYLIIEKIILFGNMKADARDIDLLIVSDDFQDMYAKKRKDFIYKGLTALKKIDVLCLTNRQYEKMVSVENEFNKNLFRKGVIVYEREN